MKSFLYIAIFVNTLIFAQKFNHNLFLRQSHDMFLNYGSYKPLKPLQNNLENAILKSKLETLSVLFRENLKQIKSGDKKIDLIFLIDSSSSVGDENFQSEIRFVKKLLSDFPVSLDTTRVAIITFSSHDKIVTNVDQISNPTHLNNKCILLNKQIPSIKFTGGGTFTLGAFLVAETILEKSTRNSQKVIFLVTDGFSNGGDPVPVALRLRQKQVTIFTIGIRNGNARELFDLSSQPGQLYSYLLDSYSEFESLARRALHSDQPTGLYKDVEDDKLCDNLCEKYANISSCCDEHATCTCGITSGQYNCLCNPGYYGAGLINYCHSCPNGTYADGPNSCKPCPDINHVTYKIPALTIKHCECKLGYKLNSKNGKCEIITCPILKPPKNGYFVSKSQCNNILNNACGVRCKVGYSLDGDSIRLCQVNGTWSGAKPSCKVKYCKLVKVPKNGFMNCTNEDNEVINIQELSSDLVPIDTQCKFYCNDGYARIGSKTRNCLPISKWDGLNADCRSIKCSRLPKLQFGYYEPKTCETDKSVFGTNCTIKCDEGFKLNGPNLKMCTGKYGHWSNKNQSICEDITPPNLICPNNISGLALSGKNYAFVNWTVPNVTDNSNLNVTLWTKPAIDDLTKFKFKIGKTIVTYIAMDAFKNKAKCNFTIEIFDKEPPIIENCVDPVPYLITGNEKVNITWDEPKIFDNSQKFVNVTKSHDFGYFSIGTTSVKYTATDMFNNTNICVLNITVQKATCEPIPNPIYGKTSCQNGIDGVHCIITCEEGYAFEIEQDRNTISTAIDQIMINDNFTELVCKYDEPFWYNNLNRDIPDCSVIEIPNETIQHGVINVEIEEDICKNESVVNQLKNEIIDNVDKNLNNICSNELECNINNLAINCSNIIQQEKIEEETNKILKRKRRNIAPATTKLTDSTKSLKSLQKNRKRSRVKIQFIINGKITEVHKVRHISSEKFKKIYERLNKIDLYIKSNETLSSKFENIQYFMDLKIEEIVAVCTNGSVSRRNKCVKCPKGTFHNVTRRSCQSCPIGHYNNKTGQLQCLQCPLLTSTRRINSKSKHDCKEKCPPGTYARKRQIFSEKKRKNPSNANPISLQPFCNSCDIAYYQSEYGKTECIKCPPNHTTNDFGAKTLGDCVPDLIQLCRQNDSKICNNGTCILENEDAYYSCECTDDYMGSHCEIQFNSCQSNPCLNGGKCVNFNSNEYPYICECLTGFLGQNCEIPEEKCLYKICRNGGTCIRNDEDEYCICRDNYLGEYCEQVKNYCINHFCENGAGCKEMENDYQCQCIKGFIGRRCHYLPCDYLPCPENSVCVNLDYMENTTRHSYRCDCLPGYTGPDCTEKINYCESMPCFNKGICVNLNTDFKCVCQAPYTGKKCEVELDSKYVLVFPKSSTNDYVKISGPMFNLVEISLCLWVQTVDVSNYGTMVSYAIDGLDNAFTITDYNGIVLYVNNDFKVTDLSINDGRWHFLCVTWKSLNGEFIVYVDGELKENGKYLSNGTQIKGNGTFVIGQEQDTMGGQFSQTESFTGKITNLDIWDRVLLGKEIFNLYETCNSYYGSVLFWGEFKTFVNGDVQFEDNPFCGECNEPTPILNGYVTVKDKVANYSCRKGFNLFFNGTNYEYYQKKCMKTAEWQDSLEPVCTIVSCDPPPNLENGQIIGEHYEYGDILTYRCDINYTLMGKSRLQCQENGNWSSTFPYCLGIQCPSVEQPGNSAMTIFMEKPSKIIKDTFDVGTKLEFKCLENTMLVGSSLIICLDNGTWNSEVPICKQIPIVTTTMITTTTTEVVTIKTTLATTFSTTEIEKCISNCTEDVNITTKATESNFTKLDSENKTIGCRRTDLPGVPLNGYYINDVELSKIFQIGEKLEFNCRFGYSFSSTNFTECLQDGVWSINDSFCKPNECKKPSKYKLMQIVDKKSQYFVGDVIYYACKEGYSGFGKNSSKCATTGTWSRVYLRCSKISCREPLVVQGAKIIGNSYLYEDKVKIECPDGTKSFEIECYANKTWLPNIQC